MPFRRLNRNRRGAGGDRLHNLAYTAAGMKPGGILEPFRRGANAVDQNSERGDDDDHSDGE